MFRLLLKVLPIFIVLVFVSQRLDSEELNVETEGRMPSPIEELSSVWVDSLMQTLTLKEKIAQLFMIAVYSNKSDAYNKDIIEQIEEYQIGGVIFMQGGPVRQAQLYNKLQTVVNVPLMVGIDGEHGLAMRLDSTVAYPKAMTLGAIADDQLLYEFGREVARQCQRVGVHINFAPVVDINSNPKNPIINVRSYGEDKYNVARKGLAYAMGMQSNNILAVSKHFPGHGDTSSDSHKTLPTVQHSKERIDSVELLPFRTLINNGVGGVMVAHLSVPNLNKGSNKPASLSAYIVDSILKKQMDFKGLVFTDALNMKGVTRDFNPGEIEVKALLAGNDVLLFPENVDVAVKAVMEAVENNIIPISLIEDRCHKILKAKKWFGLDNFKPIQSNNLVADLNNKQAVEINHKLLEASLTQIGNNADLLPFKGIENINILAVSIGQKNSIFHDMLCNYGKVDTLSFKGGGITENMQVILDTVSYYDVVIVSKHNTNNSVWKKYGIVNSEVELLTLISKQTKTVFAYFGNPYGLNDIVAKADLSSIVIGYQDIPEMNSFTAQALFGGVRIMGQLPVSIGSHYKIGQGVKQEDVIRLSYKYGGSEYAVDSTFYQIDSIMYDAIEMKATPGGQILYVKDGSVEFSKNYGFYTYEELEEVKSTSIYDLASVTKVVSTTLAMMKIYEDKKVNITSKLSSYMPEFDLKHKKRIRIDDLMAHQARFHSWIPFYRNTLDQDKKPRADLYSTELKEGYTIQITDNLFLRTDYVDSVYQTILDTPIYKTKKYRYSDLGFYWLAELIEQESKTSLDDFVNSAYYKPLGMNKTTYLPLKVFAKKDLVPTEKDNYFRYETVRGYVHDPGCAMIGGVSGHAGVFANANDLAKLGQMLVNKGKYGGEQFVDAQTLGVFTKNRFKRKGNRRAMGFDKPAMDIEDPGPTCISASQSSFGHSGFTGTYFWVDPENNSVYIFLSNRTYPSQDNTKLAKHDIRTKVQQAFYDIYQ